MHKIDFVSGIPIVRSLLYRGSGTHSDTITWNHDGEFRNAAAFRLFCPTTIPFQTYLKEKGGSPSIPCCRVVTGGRFG